jgi:hypothetical protein
VLSTRLVLLLLAATQSRFPLQTLGSLARVSCVASAFSSEKAFLCLFGLIEFFVVLLLTGVLYDLLNFNLDLLVKALISVIVRTSTFGVKCNSILFTHSVEPGVETNLVVHHRQEGVHTLGLVGQTRERQLSTVVVLGLVSGFHSKAEDLELGFKLDNLHFLVELEVAVNSPHASVEQLVEINPALLRPNSHLQHRLLELLYLSLSLNSGIISLDFHTHGNRHFPEELDQLTLLHLDAVELVSDLDPTLVESVEMACEGLDGVIILHIVRFELLDNNQDKEVKHDVSNHQNEHDVVGCCERSTTGLALNTVWGSVNTIVH